MNYQSWSKGKFWVVLVGVFALGNIMALMNNPVQVKEIIKEIPVTKEVCSKENLWKELKTIDDEGFNVAADGFYTISGIFTAIGNNDTNILNRGIADLQETTARMNNVSKTRQQILKSLGY